MRIRLGLLLLTCAAAVTLHADEAPAPATQSTAVKGAPPSLAGRWFAVANLKLKEQAKNTVAFWEVRRDGDGLVMTERFLELPPAEQAAMERADTAGEAWTPSAEAIAAIGEQWDRLSVRDVGLRSLEHEVVTADQFDALLREEPATKDALWVVRQRYAFDPGSTAAVRQENVWAGVAATREGYRANVVASTVAAAPFPIPLAFTGTGTLYRLDDPPPDTLLQRLIAMFRGCGRR